MSHSKFAYFPTFSRYFLKYNNVVYHFYAFLVTNNVYLRFEQKSGITESIKQKKSVKVYLPPPNGHGDCATDLCFTLNFNSVKLLSALAILDHTSPLLGLPFSNWKGSSYGKSEEQLPQKTVGQLAPDCRLPPFTKIFCQQLADCWPHVGNLLAKCWLRTLVEYQKSLSSQGRTLHIDEK